MFLYLCVWHLCLTMQTLVKFAETVSKAMVKLLPICKSTLNIVCVTETGESEAQLLPSWRDQICFKLQLGRCERELVTAHHGLVLLLPSCGYHHHTSARRTRCATPWKWRRGKPYRKQALVNPCWFGTRICGRMWPVVGVAGRDDTLAQYRIASLTTAPAFQPTSELLFQKRK